MIYTVTFNPALDYVIKVDNLTLGMVNRTTKEDVYYGGKGINVSVVLNNLGMKSIALGFVAGFTGEAIEKGIKKMGIATDFISLQEGMSRINVKIKSKEESEINGQGPVIHEDIYERIMESLQEKEIRIVVDATKDLLVNVLKYHPFLIKPNNHELGEIFGKTLTTDEEIVFYGKKLQEMGARNVLISMAGDGSILLAETGEVYRMGVPKGEVKNSVGAGDSMVAGFIAGYSEKEDYEWALKLGTATGSATAFSEGLAQKELVMDLLKQL